MVRRTDKKGGSWHEPPYTQEEIDDLYRRMGEGPVAFTRPSSGEQPQPHAPGAPPSAAKHTPPR